MPSGWESLVSRNSGSREHSCWDELGLIVPVDHRVPLEGTRRATHAVAQDGSCSPQRLIDVNWSEYSSFHHWKLCGQSVPGLCHSRFHYPWKWMNWPLEVQLPRILNDASLCRITACPSLCSCKSKTYIPLHPWRLIYQPPPPRRNNKKQRKPPAIKHCSALCSVGFVSRQS